MDKEIINEIFEELLTNTTSKCWTKAQIREKLSNLTQVEKYEGLEGKLNDAEQDYYRWLVKHEKNLTELIEEWMEHDREGFPEGMIDELVKGFRKDKKKNEEKLFEYERRIFEKQKEKETKTPPKVNMDDYHEEIDHENESTDNVKYERLEKSMIASQARVNFTNDNMDALTSYYSDAFYLLNSRLNNGKQWNDLNKKAQDYHTPKLNKLEKELSDAISKTSGLPYKAKLYHFGEFDITKEVGDKITFKGYLSTSFQKHVAKEWGDTYHGGRVKYTYELLTDEDTKGVCANDNSHNRQFTTLNYEHELLLDKGVTGDIVNIDVDNHIVTVKVSK